MDRPGPRRRRRPGAGREVELHGASVACAGPSAYRRRRRTRVSRARSMRGRAYPGDAAQPRSGPDQRAGSVSRAGRRASGNASMPQHTTFEINFFVTSLHLYSFWVYTATPAQCCPRTARARGRTVGCGSRPSGPAPDQAPHSARPLGPSRAAPGSCPHSAGSRPAGPAHVPSAHVHQCLLASPSVCSRPAAPPHVPPGLFTSSSACSRPSRPALVPRRRLSQRLLMHSPPGLSVPGRLARHADSDQAAATRVKPGMGCRARRRCGAGSGGERSWPSS